MKKLNTKSKVMIYGFLIGLIAANLIFQILTRKDIGNDGLTLLIGALIVIFIFGFLIGKGVRIAAIYNKAWDDGYREGKIDGAMNFGLPIKHPNCRCSTETNKPPER